ncbi:MAG: ATP-binding protein [Bryobacteraceae bacterium]|jgi:PAS domain S-box-containing protein
MQAMTTGGIFVGGSVMAEQMRLLDWSRTPLGPAETWPQSLKTTVSTCLDSKFAIVVWWGPELVTFYNDGYMRIIGNKHPHALGLRAIELWPEIWHIIGPMLEGVMQRSEATWSENLLLELERSGYPEECYFTFSYSPIRDESGGVGGVFTPVQETTSQVIGERRLRTLRDLAEGARAANAQSSEEVCRLASQTLSKNLHDIPFAAFYLFSENGKEARLAGTSGVASRTALLPELVRLDESAAQWPFASALQSTETEVIQIPGELENVPCGAWPVPPRAALAIPISPAGQHIGFALLAINPRKQLDEEYSGFLSLVGGHVTTAIAEARALEDERKRAHALAELDKAKTAFFSNVSHEFRTPLTLMLGPLEELLGANDAIPPRVTELLSVTYRNGLRLQKLVNTLLEFSRIEAGRVRASYQPTDLAAFTAELASTFRAAVEKAGLALIVDCSPLPDPVYVDREMWEKVVLNLLSNAFKYTFEGTITVRVNARDGRARLSIEDTGTGIPEQELPHLFERFHRVEGARGRTQEGTGIGLALVAELIKLHGGTVEASSIAGRGSTFTVSIPFGAAGQMAAQVLSAGPIHAESYVEEAARWLPVEQRTLIAPGVSSGKVLVADDNADMRQYLAKLLADRYQVETVANGEQALASVLDHPPDLVLSDVMMPGLDGFGLLEALRENPETRTLPVILLSARAGEEARVEGLGAGASDYLVKPFTARELLARVGAHLEMARIREEAAQREEGLRAEAEAARDRAIGVLESIQDGFFSLDKDWRFTYVNAAGERTLGANREELLGKSLWERYPETVATRVDDEYRRAVRDRVPVEFENFYEPWQRWFAVKAYPTEQGGLSVYFCDITAQKRALEALQESQDRLRAIYDGTYTYIGLLAPDGTLLEANRASLEFANNTRADVVGRPFWDGPWFTGTPGAPELIRESVARAAQGEFIRFEATVRRPSGECPTFDISFHPVRNELGEVVLIVPEGRDITDRKRTDEQLTRSNEQLTRVNRELEEFAYVASHDLQEPLRIVNIYTQLILKNLGADKAALAQFASFVQQGVTRMDALIHDLLTFSRAVHADELPVGTADLGASLREAISVLKNRIEESGSVITVEPLPTVRGDASQLAHVFQNLLSNALKYRKKDTPPQIRISAKQDGANWIVSVQDNGIGFESKYADRIFGLFKRLHKEEYPGTGLGLAICKRIVERYGGRIWAEGIPGVGATFFFLLQAVES